MNNKLLEFSEKLNTKNEVDKIELDDLKDELIILHLKYGEILEKLNSDIDRLFEMLKLVR